MIGQFESIQANGRQHSEISIDPRRLRPAVRSIEARLPDRPVSSAVDRQAKPEELEGQQCAALLCAWRWQQHRIAVCFGPHTQPAPSVTSARFNNKERPRNANPYFSLPCVLFVLLLLRCYFAFLVLLHALTSLNRLARFFARPIDCSITHMSHLSTHLLHIRPPTPSIRTMYLVDPIPQIPPQTPA